MWANIKIAVSCLLICVFSYAQDSFLDSVPVSSDRIRIVTVNDGLSQGFVSNIIQDSSGFIWIATYGGLNRYDGNEFRIFRENYLQENSISSNRITSLCAGDNGVVWVGTSEGLNRWNPANEEFESFSFSDLPGATKETNVICGVAIDGIGNVWVATHYGLIVFYPEENRFRLYLNEVENPDSLKENRLYGILVDANGSLWVRHNPTIDFSAMQDDREAEIFVQRFVPQLDGFVTYSIKVPDVPIFQTSCALDDGRVLFATHRNGLFEYSPSEDLLQPVQDAFLSKIGYVFRIVQGSDGTIYMVSKNGLLSYNPATHVSQLHQHDVDQPDSIFPWRNQYSLFVDNSGLVWIGSNGLGLAQLSKSNNKFTVLKSPSSSIARGSRYVRRLVEGEGASLWIAREGGVLQHYNSEDELLNSIAFEREIYSLFHLPDHSVLVGTFDGALYQVSKNYSKKRVGELSPRIEHIAKDNQGRILLLNERGLFYFELDSADELATTTHPVNALLENLNLDYFFVDSTDKIWLYDQQQALLVYDPIAKSIHTYSANDKNNDSLSSNIITEIHESSDGRIWVATFNGLDLYEPESRTFKYIDTVDAIKNKIIFSIEEDEQGQLWLGTSQGLICYDPNLQTTTTYSLADGLQSHEFNTRASCLLSDGDVAFGGIMGVNRFDPSHLTRNNHVPPVVVTDFKANGVSKRISTDTRIELDHQENFLSFTFAALDFHNPSENKYSYRLSGRDNKWQQAEGINTVSYFLSPGRYTLHTRASNNDGVWNEEGVKLNIFIHPPFWDTAWFRMLLAMVTLGTALIIYKVRSEAIKRRARRLESLNTRLEEQMVEISSLNNALQAFDYSVSNALQAPVRQIRHFNEFLKESLNTSDLDLTRKYADRIDTKLEEVVSLIDGLLSLSRAKNQELDTTAVNITTLARKEFSELVGQEGYSGVLTIQEELIVNKDPILMRILFSNLISNAIKFSQSHERPRVEIGRKKGVFYVKDNGEGIAKDRHNKVLEPFHSYHTDISFHGNGLGLATCRIIVERYGGELMIDSAEKQGTTVKFSLG